MELLETTNGGSNMLYNNFTEKLLDLQGAKVTNIEKMKKILQFILNLKGKATTVLVAVPQQGQFTTTELKRLKMFLSEEKV